jgi:hypothetical protein
LGDEGRLGVAFSGARRFFVVRVVRLGDAALAARELLGGDVVGYAEQLLS